MASDLTPDTSHKVLSWYGKNLHADPATGLQQLRMEAPQSGILYPNYNIWHGWNQDAGVQLGDVRTPIHTAIVIPDKGSTGEAVYYYLVIGGVATETVVYTTYYDGTILKRQWDSPNNRWNPCAVDDTRSQKLLAEMANANFNDANIDPEMAEAFDPMDTTEGNTATPDAPASNPTATPTIPPNQPINQEKGDAAPGSFAAGVEGLPSDPGHFKTPGGYCRKWEPWERAIIQLQQEKNKKELSAWAEKTGCVIPVKKCHYTVAY
jgi:hypothetical protein